MSEEWSAFFQLCGFAIIIGLGVVAFKIADAVWTKRCEHVFVERCRQCGASRWETRSKP